MLTGQQFGRYEIRSKIGEGGMGEVYTAVDSELGRSVAIKLLPNDFTSDEERRSRFRQEARVISALNHPNIITIFEIGENEHGSFLATELVDGRTLREVISRESLTLTRILRIVEQAANGLVAAHAAGIVHRDVKPENIMVRRDSIVKVLDFGLAKPNEQIITASGSDNKTVPGTVMGSARYMSPEQARGQTVDERTDIWSLGVVLYEMLAGTVPFDGESTADTLAAVIYKEPEPIGHLLPNIPLELQRIMRKALQKDREERYQSMKDLALDIKDLLYAIEHANSGDRIGAAVISGPEFSENPTIIHRTVSGNHPTSRTVAHRSQAENVSTDGVRGGGWNIALVAIAAVLLMGMIGLGVYSWYDGETALVAGAFEKTQISRIDTDGKVMQPAISPDGRYVAYVSGEVGNNSLVVKQISTGSSVTVVPSTNLKLHSVTFSPDGEFVYYLETRSDHIINNLFRVPTLGGTPKKLVEDVDSTVTFSPDGKQFAFMRHVSRGSSDNVFVVDTETLEAQPLISTTDTDYNFFSNRLAWSPDGRKILLGAGRRQSAFITGTDVAEIDVAERSIRRINDKDFFFANHFVWLDDGSGFLFIGKETMSGSAQVWRSPYPAVEIQPVTNDFNDYQSLSISADGRSLITGKGDTSSSIWRYSPATKAAVQLTSESRNLEGANGLIQTRDGKLLYTRHEAREADIWISDADGKNARALLADPGYSVVPVLTPDGKHIVFNLQKDKNSGIWRADADGKNLVRLTGEDAQTADFNPQVTPDGQWVIFQRKIPSADSSVIAKVPVQGGPVETIFSAETTSAFLPRISPDGKRIVFITYDMATYDQKLRVASFDNGRIGPIERDLEYNLINQVFWAPDSRSLTILTNRGGVQNIWRLPLDGSPAAPITEFRNGRILNFAWSSDGKNLLIARGNTNNDLILIRDTSSGPGTPETARRRTLRPVG